ncbi:hypothetical protein NM208_g14646 [Fusarium decemcellulare]|uniref:Uncharacterized protein n=1 Tax=Fusarium decemcellulare TaxID=57161 RepID=A0ACC1RH57_9HYPO|nr:hypothetical protein NM208_g14646 [Fusarium decemcellulare]
MIHELCCLWSIDKTAVYEIFDSLAQPNTIDFTFNELQRILNNDDLSPESLQWFSRFPWPVTRVFNTFPERVLAVRLASFMLRFAAFWQPLLDDAEIKGRPISSSISRRTLGCPSPVLRYIFFVTSSLHIGIVTGPDADAWDQYFDKGEAEQVSIGGQTVRQALALEHNSFLNRQMSL